MCGRPSHTSALLLGDWKTRTSHHSSSRTEGCRDSAPNGMRRRCRRVAVDRCDTDERTRKRARAHFEARSRCGSERVCVCVFFVCAAPNGGQVLRNSDSAGKHRTERRRRHSAHAHHKPEQRTDARAGGHSTGGNAAAAATHANRAWDATAMHRAEKMQLPRGCARERAMTATATTAATLTTADFPNASAIIVVVEVDVEDARR